MNRQVLSIEVLPLHAGKVNTLLGQGYTYLKTTDNNTVILAKFGNAPHSWTYSRTVEVEPKHFVKLGCNKEYPPEMSSTDAIEDLYVTVEDRFNEIIQRLRQEGKIRR